MVVNGVRERKDCRSGPCGRVSGETAGPGAVRSPVDTRTEMSETLEVVAAGDAATRMLNAAVRKAPNSEIGRTSFIFLEKSRRAELAVEFAEDEKGFKLIGRWIISIS